jgi:hypothetical protein
MQRFLTRVVPLFAIVIPPTFKKVPEEIKVAIPGTGLLLPKG